MCQYCYNISGVQIPINVRDAKFSSNGGIHAYHGSHKSLKVTWASVEFKRFNKMRKYETKDSYSKLRVQGLYTKVLLHTMKSEAGIYDLDIAERELARTKKLMQILLHHPDKKLRLKRTKKSRESLLAHLTGDFPSHGHTINDVVDHDLVSPGNSHLPNPKLKSQSQGDGVFDDEKDEVNTSWLASVTDFKNSFVNDVLSQLRHWRRIDIIPSWTKRATPEVAFVEQTVTLPLAFMVNKPSANTIF
ncbi:hypothetical protein CJJ07_002583 [Candidozyma auris]|nr:hypothetical protein CJJ07_002583 [[Candida] auris]QEL63052.1 hypothetical protein CJJ09_005246 [[Candida] auris]